MLYAHRKSNDGLPGSILHPAILYLAIIPGTILSQQNTPSPNRLSVGSQLKIITKKDNKRKETVGTVVNWKTDSVEMTAKDQTSLPLGIDEIQKMAGEH